MLFDYINGRVEKSDVRKYVRFDTVARWTEYNQDTEEFTVVVDDLRTGSTSTHFFDKLIVASGHFSTPNVPEFEGIETFPGTLMHAHDFRGAEDLAGKDILLVGSSYSVEDIGMQAYKMGAASVTFSYRTAPMGFDWPDGVVERPLVTRFDGRTAHFSDGTQADFEAVILWTGYQHKFPFLPTELALSTPNVLYPANLYKGVLWQENPNLMYLGMQDQYFTFNMFDAQAWFARDVIMGRIALPSEAERSADMRLWLDFQSTISSHFDDVDFQTEYLRDLIAATDCPSFNLARVVDLFKQWLKDKESNIVGYRNDTHTSVMTGSEASVHHTPWLHAMDDSLEQFLRGVSR